MEAFAVLSDPSRRKIIELLSQGAMPVSAIQSEFSLSQPAVSQHLRTLREAGLVEFRVDAQRRIYQLKMGPLDEASQWIERVRQFWSRRLEAMDDELARNAGEKR